MPLLRSARSSKKQNYRATGDLIDLLAALIDKSLVTARPVEGAEEIGLRYEFQEVVRQYALEKLNQSGKGIPSTSGTCPISSIMPRRAGEVITPAPGWSGITAWARISTILLAAVDWAYASPGRAEAGVRIAIALTGLFWTRGLHHEQLAMLRKGLGFPLPALLRARLLNTIAGYFNR